MLRQRVVFSARRAPEMIETQAKARRDVALHAVHFGAEIGHRLVRLGGRQFRRGPMFIGGA